VPERCRLRLWHGLTSRGRLELVEDLFSATPVVSTGEDGGRPPPSGSGRKGGGGGGAGLELRGAVASAVVGFPQDNHRTWRMGFNPARRVTGEKTPERALPWGGEDDEVGADALGGLDHLGSGLAGGDDDSKRHTRGQLPVSQHSEMALRPTDDVRGGKVHGGHGHGRFERPEIHDMEQAD